MASNPVIIVAGFGPAISRAVAWKFGKERAYSVALLCRTKSKLDAAVDEFAGQGVKAVGYAVDLSKADDMLAVIKKIQQELGAISILFWNAGGSLKSVFDATSEDIHFNITMSVDNLLIASKALLTDLEKTKGAILVTGGGLGDNSAIMSDLAVAWGAMTIAVNKAAQRRLVHVLHSALKPKGVFVGEVTVMSGVRGTPFDPEGKSSLTAEAVADAFASLLDKRDAPITQIS